MRRVNKWHIGLKVEDTQTGPYAPISAWRKTTITEG